MSNQASNSIDALGARIARVEFGDIDAPAKQALRLHLLDTLAAWIAATTTAEGKALIAFHDDLRALEGAADGPDNAFDAVATHCALARLSEVDDIHLGSMTTPGALVIPAALTLAAARDDSNAGDIAAAILAGYEAMIRLGLAIKGPYVLARGIWPSYFAAPFAGAAMAARLLRLNAEQAAHALALALPLAAPSVGQHRSATAGRWLSIGNAVRNGLTAAFAARAGFTGDRAFLESRLLSDLLGSDSDAAQIAPGAGAPWLIAEVSFKPWWGARQTMAATQGLRELMGEGLAVSDVQEIVASVPPPHLKMIDHGVVPGNRSSYMTSLPYQMANAVLRPEAMLDIGPFHPNESEAVRTLMDRIKVRGDQGLLTDYPQAWPARVTVTTARGTAERFVRHIPGDPACPFSEVELNEKFRALVAPVLDEAGARRLWETGLAALQAPPGSAAPLRELNRMFARATRAVPTG